MLHQLLAKAKLMIQDESHITAYMFDPEQDVEVSVRFSWSARGLLMQSDNLQQALQYMPEVADLANQIKSIPNNSWINKEWIITQLSQRGFNDYTKGNPEQIRSDNYER